MDSISSPTISSGAGPVAPRVRTVFMGTADLAAAVLQRLAQAPDCVLLAAVVQPDRPQGRNLQPKPPPAKTLALQLGLPVLQPERARAPDFLAQMEVLAPELIVVAAYGQILPDRLLRIPRWGCLNVHTSLLPRFRGAAPIQYALLHGDTVTGVTIMRLDSGLDTGAILSQRSLPIGADETADQLHDRLAVLGADLLLETLPAYVAGRVQPRPQPEIGVTYAPKIRREDGRIDWTQSATALRNRLRAFTPWPGLFTHLPGPTPAMLLKIWAAAVVGRSGPPGQVLEAQPENLIVACGEAALHLLEVQREGGRRLPAREFLAGHPIPIGTRLGLT